MTIYATKGGSFDKVSNWFVSPRNSIISERSKSLACKVRSLTRIIFDTEARNFAWDENLKKMDGVALTNSRVFMCSP